MARKKMVNCYQLITKKVFHTLPRKIILIFKGNLHHMFSKTDRFMISHLPAFQFGAPLRRMPATRAPLLAVPLPQSLRAASHRFFGRFPVRFAEKPD
jgi:hypothetical protein